ncbi:MAG: hypothetical protein U5K75_00080 [Ahrensia sp.]|nr:hypothetical protein [Ahrensia sp.]
MALPDRKRALVRYCEAPVLDPTSGATTKKVCFYKYATTEPAAAVEAANYWNFAGTFLKVGDRIEALCVADGVADGVNLTVRAVTGAGVVTVAADAG